MADVLPARPWPLTLEEIRVLLAKRQGRSEMVEPQAGDEDNYVGDTQTVAANATTVVTWTLKKDYIYYFKKFYADAIANVTYSWKLTKVLGFYEGIKEMDGNEHVFDLPIRAQGGATLTLTLVNTSTQNNVDIVLNSWARRVVT